MELICIRSGIKLQTTTAVEYNLARLDSAKVALAATHPIFLMSNRAILETLAESNTNANAAASANASASAVNLFDYSAMEQKLILLALLNANSLIQWQATPESECFSANPLDELVIPALEKMLLIAAKGSSILASKSLPKIAVSENQDPLLGLLGFLDAILEALAGTRVSPDEVLLSQQLRIEALVRSAKGDDKKLRQLRASCCSWVLAVTQKHFQAERITKDTVAHWTKILKSSPQEVADMAMSAVDVAELEDFLVSYLPLGSVAAHEVLTHVELLKEAAGSLGSYLFGSANRTKQLPDKEFKPRAPMPKKADYKNPADWVLALKIWNEVSRMTVTVAEPEQKPESGVN
jgi:hypothetical protein